MLLTQRWMVRLLGFLAIGIGAISLVLVLLGKVLEGTVAFASCPVFVWLWLMIRKQALVITDSHVYSVGGSFKRAKAVVEDSVAWAEVEKVRYVLVYGQKEGSTTTSNYLIFDRKSGGRLAYLIGFAPSQAEREQLKQICESLGVPCQLEPEIRKKD